MSVIRLGELNLRLAIEAPVRTPDGGGGASVAWTEVAEVWGAIRTLGGGERQEADGLSARATHEIWIRYSDAVRPEMRFVLDERVFDIRAVVASAGRRRFLKCLVEERLP